ncbi:hypothetical protein AVEN_187385-1 [Araneus ventricosus]|uniref:Uncharacterized protein n=1 Tax=Araneus ventricosus TaxID=182803 RepID=A0A4Y2Q530_ARAVE|nr:hypothetical protein AVEN_187385-1 [Araneus ventricosus]
MYLDLSEDSPATGHHISKRSLSIAPFVDHDHDPRPQTHPLGLESTRMDGLEPSTQVWGTIGGNFIDSLSDAIVAFAMVKLFTFEPDTNHQAEKSFRTLIMP